MGEKRDPISNTQRSFRHLIKSLAVLCAALQERERLTYTRLSDASMGEMSESLEALTNEINELPTNDPAIASSILDLCVVFGSFGCTPRSTLAIDDTRSLVGIVNNINDALRETEGVLTAVCGEPTRMQETQRKVILLLKNLVTAQSFVRRLREAFSFALAIGK